jgi:hypothetical protein
MHINYDAIWNGFLVLKEREIKIRCITEVTSENLIYCKKFIAIAKLRHIAGVRSSFGIALIENNVFFMQSQMKNNDCLM